VRVCIENTHNILADQRLQVDSRGPDPLMIQVVKKQSHFVALAFRIDEEPIIWIADDIGSQKLQDTV
jgi:hypothetical protein